MNTRDKLLAEIERFLVKTGMNAANFGIAAVNNPAFVLRLRKNKDITLASYDKIKQFMKSHRKVKP